MEKKRFLYLLLELFFLFQPLYSIDNLRFTDARTLALGGNGVTETVLFNPSLIALSDYKTLEMNYINRYQLKELGSINAGFRLPNSLLPLAFHIFSFGYDAYRESMFRLSIGKKLNQRWAIGLAFHYSMLETELYEERKSRIATDLGITFQTFDKLLIGMLIMNFPSVHLGDKATESKDFTGFIFQMGFRWEVINHLLITGHMGSSEAAVLTGSLGMEYQAFSSFYLRAGLQTKPLLPGFGIGYGFASFALDIATVYHPVLGMSTGVGLSYSF